MSVKPVHIELTKRQIELLLKYSYPFDHEREQLERMNGIKDEFQELSTDDFYAPRLVGDLAYSAKEIDNEMLLDELDELCEIVDTALLVAERNMKLGT